MSEDTRVRDVRQIIADYTKSPSLRHIRDPYALNKLAQQIVRALERTNSTWQKWNSPREDLLKAAMLCWIPIADMQEYLNRMEGPHLTATDVEQRLRSFHEERFASFPNELLWQGCLALYEAEKAAGTELPAIVGALQEYVEVEEERLRTERDAAWKARADADRVALEQRFLSGADCKWTPIRKSKELYCRINGRAYRLSPTNDKKWDLYRILSAEDDKGVIIGRYQHRGDAGKALRQIAYQPEPRW